MKKKTLARQLLQLKIELRDLEARVDEAIPITEEEALAYAEKHAEFPGEDNAAKK